jgi:hypothetical protein
MKKNKIIDVGYISKMTKLEDLIERETVFIVRLAANQD